MRFFSASSALCLFFALFRTLVVSWRCVAALAVAWLLLSAFAMSDAHFEHMHSTPHVIFSLVRHTWI
jgi:hypothetical protein